MNGLSDAPSGAAALNGASMIIFAGPPVSWRILA